MSTTRAVVLARGLGTRMREADPDAGLAEDQARAADAGLKPMIPVNGRPFMDYVLSAIADAGIRDVAIVVAPDHDALRRYYVSEAPPSRIGVSFVVQPEPLGTADALLAAERWAGRDGFLAMNADNLYPTGTLAALAALDEPGLAAFERDDLVRSGNIPPDRVRAFALIDVDTGADGSTYLTRIVEKPRADEPQALVSMNCWRFDARIFSACRDVPRSARGELELPEAVGLAVRRGVPFRVLRARGAVLDLTRRADAADVARRLAGRVARP
jgi:glucose-1-phosphate thymidylyltransferase